MMRTAIAALSTVGIVLSMSAISAFAASGANVGLLKCTVNGGIGLIIGSSKGMTCQFEPAGGGSHQTYKGSVGKLDVDIGITSKSYIRWRVIACGKLKPGALAGSYGGVTTQATVGVGLGANVLIGG